MPLPFVNRRRFLQGLTGAAAAGQLLALNATHVPGAETTSQTGRPIRLGGPAFQAPQDPEGLALAHRKLGYRAAYCPAVDIADRDKISAISNAFSKHDVVIAEVGRWCNLLEADADQRAKNLAQVTEGLALADEIGARCCVDIAGSFSRDFWYGPHPENCSPRFFDAAVENARKIIDAVKPKRAKFCYEMMGWALPDSADSYVQMIKAVEREAFGVHLDPCNLVNSPARFYDNTALLNECFDKLGPWIASCHAKDITWDVEMQVHFREVPLGTGSLDYTTYLRRLVQLPGNVPLMIEHMQGEQQYTESRQYLFGLAAKAGVSFG
jgi:sugar phosphate isomerase/epimerase